MTTITELHSSGMFTTPQSEDISETIDMSSYKFIQLKCTDMVYIHLNLIIKQISTL